jgi:hypothetical protein
MMTASFRYGFSTLLLVLCLLQAPAMAYIDPGQGSIMLQAVLAGGAGVAVVLKMYWFQVKTFVLRTIKHK